MNNSSILKLSLVCASVLATIGAYVPQRALASETGTVPIIKAFGAPSFTSETGTVPIISTKGISEISLRKDNGTIPIIATPSTNEIEAPTPGSGDQVTFTITITVDAPVSQNTTVNLSTNNPGAIGLPSTATITTGNSSVTTTVSVTPGQNLPPAGVQIAASCNNLNVNCSITVTYPS